MVGRAGRPCERCIKRGLAASCRDGVRNLAPRQFGVKRVPTVPAGAVGASIGPGSASAAAGGDIYPAHMYAVPAIALPGTGLDLRGTRSGAIAPSAMSGMRGAPHDGLVFPLTGVAPPSALMSLVAAGAAQGQGFAASAPPVRHPRHDPPWGGRPTDEHAYASPAATTHPATPAAPVVQGAATRYAPAPELARIAAPAMAAAPGPLSSAVAALGGPLPPAAASTAAAAAAAAAAATAHARQPMSPDQTFVSAALNRELTGMTDIMTAPVPPRVRPTWAQPWRLAAEIRMCVGGLGPGGSGGGQARSGAGGCGRCDERDSVWGRDPRRL
jgi:hypothetical protein